MCLRKVKFLKFGLLIALLLVTSVTMSSCNSKEKSDTEEIKKDNLLISGTIKGANGQKVYLEAMSQNGTIPVANTVISNDKFEMNTNIPGLSIYQLRVGELPDNAIVLTAAPGDKITVDAPFDNFVFDAKISGVDWERFILST